MQEKIFNRTFNINTLIPKFADLFPTDPVLGDHYYSNEEYKRLFKDAGFRIVKQISNFQSKHTSFVLVSDV